MRRQRIFPKLSLSQAEPAAALGLAQTSPDGVKVARRSARANAARLPGRGGPKGAVLKAEGGRVQARGALRGQARDGKDGT